MSKKSAFAAIILAVALSALAGCGSAVQVGPHVTGQTSQILMCKEPQVPLCGA